MTFSTWFLNKIWYSGRKNWNSLNLWHAAVACYPPESGFLRFRSKTRVEKLKHQSQVSPLRIRIKNWGKVVIRAKVYVLFTVLPSCYDRCYFSPQLHPSKLFIAEALRAGRLGNTVRHKSGHANIDRFASAFLHRLFKELAVHQEQSQISRNAEKRGREGTPEQWKGTGPKTRCVNLKSRVKFQDWNAPW